MQNFQGLIGPFRQLAPDLSRVVESGQVAVVLQPQALIAAFDLPPDCIKIALDAEGNARIGFDRPSDSVDAVFVLDVLQAVTNYRRLCAEVLRILKPGGFCFFRVPHQFLYERRFSLGSAFDKRNKRFYTPASLMMEWEEAAGPLEYRLRALRDNDAGFDYSTKLTDPPKGEACIEMLIEKIAPPSWSQEIVDFGNRQIDERRASDDFTSRAGPAPVVAMRMQPEKTTSILVLKLDHRGDFLIARSAFSRLRTGFPQAHITLVCGEWNGADARASGFFDEVVPFSIFDEQANANRPDLFKQSGQRLKEMLAGRAFDLAIDLRINDDTRFLLDLVQAETRAGFPSVDVERKLDIVLPYYNPTDVERPVRKNFHADAFAVNVGEHRGLMTELNKETPFNPGECLVYGPYRSLEVGRLEFTIHLEAAEPHWIGFDVCYDHGASQLTKGVMLAGSPMTSFSVDVPMPLDHVEIRLITVGKTVKPFRFYGVSYERKGQMTGTHQSEMMSLLVTLVEERTRFRRERQFVAA